MDGLADRAERAGRLAVSVGIVAYCAGFVIANVHLGGLGIFSVELVRGRYVLVGGLFLGFVLASVAPVLSFYGRVRATPPPVLIADRFLIFAGVALRHLGIFALLVFGLVQVGGQSSLLHPPALPGQLSSLGSLVLLVLKIWAGYIVLDFIVRCLSAMRNKKPFRTHMSELAAVNGKGLLVALGLLMSLVAQKVMATPDLGVLGAWLRFFAIAFAVSLYGVNYPMVYGMGPDDPAPGSTAGELEPTPWWKAITRGAIAMAFGLMLLGVYCTHVFPYVPWSFGGGAPVCARLELGEPGSPVGEPVDVLILDRTEARLFGIANTPNDAREVFEVAMERVQRITFCPRRQ